MMPPENHDRLLDQTMMVALAGRFFESFDLNEDRHQAMLDVLALALDEHLQPVGQRHADGRISALLIASPLTGTHYCVDHSGVEIISHEPGRDWAPFRQEDLVRLV